MPGDLGVGSKLKQDPATPNQVDAKRIAGSCLSLPPNASITRSRCHCSPAYTHEESGDMVRYRLLPWMGSGGMSPLPRVILVRPLRSTSMSAPMNVPDAASRGRSMVSAPYSGRVMISSAMRGYGVERAALAQVIKEVGLTPWYAEEPPAEFAGVSGETLSFEMAARCDLYLLIIFPRYGSQVYPDDTRAVTHLEFEQARIVPRRVRAFIAQEALERADGGG